MQNMRAKLAYYNYADKETELDKSAQIDVLRDNELKGKYSLSFVIII